MADDDEAGTSARVPDDHGGRKRGWESEAQEDRKTKRRRRTEEEDERREGEEEKEHEEEEQLHGGGRKASTKSRKCPPRDIEKEQENVEQVVHRAKTLREVEAEEELYQHTGLRPGMWIAVKWCIEYDGNSSKDGDRNSEHREGDEARDGESKAARLVWWLARVSPPRHPEAPSTDLHDEGGAGCYHDAAGRPLWLAKYAGGESFQPEVCRIVFLHGNRLTHLDYGGSTAEWRVVEGCEATDAVVDVRGDESEKTDEDDDDDDEGNEIEEGETGDLVVGLQDLLEASKRLEARREECSDFARSEAEELRHSLSSDGHVVQKVGDLHNRYLALRGGVAEFFHRIVSERGRNYVVTQEDIFRFVCEFLEKQKHDQKKKEGE